MRKTRLLILLALSFISFTFPYAQTIPISGVINTYHRVVDIISARSCVVVDNATGLGPGDKVMLVQMKGASVVTNNNTTFGDTANLNGAGNYELGTVCTVSGDSVFLLNMIVHNYTLTGKVQLVSIPVYENAIVMDSLKAKPWSNSEGKGGVLALSVTYSLFLNAPVSATGAGFKGGLPVLSSGVCGNSFFPPPASASYYDASNTNPQNGAYKGESVYDITNPGYTGGKAALANGGGGGNNHNNGGGGGANLSAGGRGGGNNSSAGCTVSNPGEGGNALENWSGTKIFLGGGGGAGHINNGDVYFEGGGDGGGIIYIQAQSIMSSGYTISANGVNGGEAKGDGAAGGGGGGTIIMNVLFYSDPVSMEAKGGDGGQENDDLTDGRCYGEGGGGGGGVIYLKGGMPAGTLSVSGGVKGLKFNGLNCRTPVPGSDGASGVITPNYTPPQATELSPACTFVLPATLLYFKASITHNDVVTRWQVAQPEDARVYVVERKQEDESWKEVVRVPPRTGVDTYTAPDRKLAAGKYLYRLKIISKDGATVFSSQQRVHISARQELTVYPNPARDVLQVMLPEGADKELRIFDLSGRLLLQKRIAGTRSPLVSLDVSSLNKGLYILRIGMLHKMFRIQ